MPVDKPSAILPQPENFPEELRALPQWVLWRYEPPLKEGDKWRKIPYTPGGSRASTNKPQTWRNFRATLTLFENGGYDGIGFVFTLGDDYLGIDIDECRDQNTGAVPKWVDQFIDTFDSYTECSVSGSGVHLIVKGSFPINGPKRQEHIEMYQERRFFTMTGHLLRATGCIASRQVEVDALRAKLFVKPTTPEREAKRGAITYADAEILAKATSAKNGSLVQTLYSGNPEATGRYRKADGSIDLSRADFGLIGCFKLYTQDPVQLERLMRASNLNRPKWDEKRGNESWIQYSINEALKTVTEVYSPPANPSLIKHNGKSHTGQIKEVEPEQEEEEPDDENAEPPRFIIHSFSELRETIPEPEPIVAGITYRGSLAANCGDGGTGKTYYCLAKAVAVAAGLPFLGKETTQGTVLIIDEESGHRRLHSRLNAILRGLDYTGGDLPIYWITASGFNFGSPADVVEMERIIAELNPILVIVDALMEVTAGADENSVADLLPALHRLHGWCQRFDLGTDLIHHNNKGGKYRGSSAIKGVVDQLLIFEKEQGKDLMIIRSEKNRDGEDFSLMAKLEFSSFPVRKVTLTGVLDSKFPGPKLTPAQRWVHTFFHVRGRATVNDLEEEAIALRRYAAGTVRNAAWELVSKGILRRVDEGSAGQLATLEAAVEVVI